jgi:hypothetical protein
MSVVVKFGDRLRSVGSWLEDEFLSVVSGFNILIGQQHYLDTGAHRDITCDSISSNRGDRVMPFVDGHRWELGPWFLDALGNSSNFAVIRPPTLTANQNDYAPFGHETAVGMDLTSTANRDITGIKATARQKRLLFIGNRGTFIISLIHQSASSLAANQFSIDSNQDYWLGPNQYIWLYYDTDSEKWRIIGQSQPVYIDAYLPTTSQSINSGVATKVQFAAENYDSHSLFDSTTNYRFTAPTKGLYWISTSVLFQPNATATPALRVDIQKNGIGIASSFDGNQTNQVFVAVAVSRLVSMVAGDYIEIFATQDSGAAMNLFRATESTWLSIFRYH